MAKRNKKDVNNAAKDLQEQVLPQNILLLGEQGEELKKLYVFQSVYKEIHHFTENKTSVEAGGILVGHVIEEFGKTNIIITGFVEAKHSQGTATTLTFTHETWDYVHKTIEKKHKGKKIIGWIHTHPDFGIFLSEYDRFIQQNFFNEDSQIAYVVDPIQNVEGFYYWSNGNIERCKGFYICDETGKMIDIQTEPEIDDAEKSVHCVNGKSIALGVLAVVVLVLAIVCLNLRSTIKKLEQQYDTLYAQYQYVYAEGKQYFDKAAQLEIENKDLQNQLSTTTERESLTPDSAQSDSTDDPISNGELPKIEAPIETEQSEENQTMQGGTI